MSLQILEYSKDRGSFSLVEGLQYYQAFKEFREVEELEELEVSSIFKQSKAFGQFQGFQEFKESLATLSCISYYQDFQLLLCSLCSSAVNRSSLSSTKRHLAKHFPGPANNRNQKTALSRAGSILQGLEVSSLAASLELIQGWVPCLCPFRELPLLANLFQCLFCSCICSSKAGIQEHLRKRHKIDRQENPDLDLSSSYTVVAKGQNLEANRFYFQVDSKGKGKGKDNSKDNSKDKSNSKSKGRCRSLSRSRSKDQTQFQGPAAASLANSTEEEEGEGERGEEEQEDSVLGTARSLFLAGLSKKEKQLQEGVASYRLDRADNLSPFQVRTRYVNFLDKHDLSALVSLYSLPKPEERKEESLLSLLVLNLQGLFYTSIDRSVYLSKVYLNLLNSFEKDRVKNTPFKPLLRSETTRKYFDLFSSFAVFVFRSFADTSFKTAKLYSLSQEAAALLAEITKLLSIEEELLLEQELDPGKVAKKARRSLKSRYTRLRLRSFLQDRFPAEGEREEGEAEEEEGREEEGGEEEEEEVSSIGSGSSTSTSSLLSSNSSERGLDSPGPDLDSCYFLKQARFAEEAPGQGSLLVKEKLLALLLLFLKQDTGLYSFSSPVYSFFACKSIRPNLSFRDSLEFSQYYSAFLYCSQLLVIEYSFQEAFKTNNPFLLYSTIKDFMSSYFNNSIPSCLGEILNLRSYCFAINKSLSSLSNIAVDFEQGGSVTCKKTTLSIGDLKELFKQAIAVSEVLLQEELLFGIDYTKELRSFTLEAFGKVEDLYNSTPFKCFRDFHPEAALYNKYLISKLLDLPRLRRRFFTLADSKLVLSRRQAKLYLQQVQEFLKSCLLLVYFTGGLPLRGTELCTFQYLNSNKGRRELYLDRSTGLFIVNILANKARRDLEQGANICYLPRQVSEIFLAYIVLVAPLAKMLDLELASSSSWTTSLSPYFFCSSSCILTSRDLSYKVNYLANLVLGKRLNIQTYRQIIVGIIQNFMLERVDESSLTLLDQGGESKGDSRDIAARQINHSIGVEQLHYARPAFLLPNIRGNIQLKYLQFCWCYFAFFDLLGHSPKSGSTAAPARARENLGQSSRDLVANSLALRFNKASLHSSLTPGSSSSSITLGLSRKHSRSVSSLSTVLQDKTPLKKVKLLDLQEISSSTTSSIILLNLLREFLSNAEACYKSQEQELLVRSTLLKAPYILGVLATNQGKSLSYLLASSLVTSNITLVIIPLVGLKLNIQERAAEFNIPCSVFEKEQEFSTLTLLSIETVRNANFIFKVKDLVSQERLDRVVVDECHLLFTSRSYRPIMFKFREFLELPVQFVFLSGTFPPYLEESFRREFPLQELTCIRGSTARANISYLARPYQSKKEGAQFLELREYIDASLSAFASTKDKILVFCPSAAKAARLGDFLDCPVYYSSLEGKEEILASYLNNTDAFNQMIVSTSGLEEGIDYPSIRTVVYVDYIHSFIGFLQGSSRGGRDTKPSTSILFYTSFNLDNRLDDSKDKLYISKYLLEQVCRRRVIDLYLDNAFTDQCSASSAKCDLCSRRLAITAGTIASLLDSNKEAQSKRDWFAKIVVNLQSTCLLCLLVKDRPSAAEHTTKHCTVVDVGRPARQFFTSYQTSIRPRLAVDSCCFTCFLPTVVCSFLKTADNRCLDSLLIARFFCTCLLFLDRLGLASSFRLDPSHRVDFGSLERVFFAKVYLEDLRTESILGVQVFFSLLQEYIPELEAEQEGDNPDR